MPDNEAELFDQASSLNTSITGASVRWNHREARRWQKGEDDFEPGSVEFAIRVNVLDGVLDSAAFVRVCAPEGPLHFDLGIQFHAEGDMSPSEEVIAEFGRRFAAPLLLGHLRGAISTECLIMSWDSIVLPPSLESAVISLEDHVILGIRSE